MKALDDVIFEEEENCTYDIEIEVSKNKIFIKILLFLRPYR